MLRENKVLEHKDQKQNWVVQSQSLHWDLAGKCETLFPGRPLHFIIAVHPSLGQRRIRRTITFQNCIPYRETSWENTCWAMKYILLPYLHYLTLHESQLGKTGLRTEPQAFKNTRRVPQSQGFCLNTNLYLALDFWALQFKSVFSPSLWEAWVSFICIYFLSSILMTLKAF